MEMFAKRISALDPFLQHDKLGSLDKEAFIMQRRGGALWSETRNTAQKVGNLKLVKKL